MSLDHQANHLICSLCGGHKIIVQDSPKLTHGASRLPAPVDGSPGGDALESILSMRCSQERDTVKSDILEDLSRQTCDTHGSHGTRSSKKHDAAGHVDVYHVNTSTIEKSAEGLNFGLRGIAWFVGLAGVVFVLVGPSKRFNLLAAKAEGEIDSDHRRLGGGGGHGMMASIAYSTVGAGLWALGSHALRQPLLLGYILGGVFVGPIGLQLVTDPKDIENISDIGLVLLLFMIGLELDLRELRHMGRTLIVTGILQFPICAIAMCLIFFP